MGSVATVAPSEARSRPARATGERAPAHERAPTQTVDRALTVLGYFTATEPDLSSAEIAARLGLHQTTAYRLLSTMEASGYVERDLRTGRYRLGLKVVELAGLKLNQMDLCRHALPELDALRDTLNLNANLAVLEQGDVCHLAYAVRPDVPRNYTLLGRRSVAHCTALGKVMLAFRPRPQVHALIKQHGWRPYTTRSLQDFEALDRALDEIAARGYAVDEGERRVEIKCVAAPVRDRAGAVVAAISVSGDQAMVEPLGIERIIGTVTQRADAVSARLGHVESWRR